MCSYGIIVNIHIVECPKADYAGNDSSTQRGPISCQSALADTNYCVFALYLIEGHCFDCYFGCNFKAIMGDVILLCSGMHSLCVYNNYIARTAK